MGNLVGNEGKQESQESTPNTPEGAGSTGPEDAGGANAGADLEARLAEAERKAAALEAEKVELTADAEAWRQKQEDEKTDLEKAQTALAERDSALEAARLENARLKAATKFGIAEENLDLLTGSSAEELEARAGRLAELQQQSVEPPAPQSKTPKESLKSGVGDDPETPDNAFPASWNV